jgi:hypothetical protein
MANLQRSCVSCNFFLIFGADVGNLCRRMGVQQVARRLWEAAKRLAVRAHFKGQLAGCAILEKDVSGFG